MYYDILLAEIAGSMGRHTVWQYPSGVVPFICNLEDQLDQRGN